MSVINRPLAPVVTPPPTQRPLTLRAAVIEIPAPSRWRRFQVVVKYSQTCCCREVERIPRRVSLRQSEGGGDGSACAKESTPPPLVSSHHCLATAGPLWLICPAPLIYSLVRDRGWTPSFNTARIQRQLGKIFKQVFSLSLSSFATLFLLH